MGFASCGLSGLTGAVAAWSWPMRVSLLLRLRALINVWRGMSSGSVFSAASSRVAPRWSSTSSVGRVR